MNKAISLTVESRDHIGHQANRVRLEGKIPGTIYGKGIKSLSVGVPMDTFLSVYKEAGETHLLDLSCNGKTYPALIHFVQKHPASRKIIHVEFMTVNLTEKLKTQVPVKIVGEAPAVKEGLGTLLITLNNIEIETFPNTIPEGIEVDVSSLSEVNAEVKVQNMTVPEGVTILTDKELTVAKVGAIVVEVQAAPVATEEAVSAEAPTETTETPEQSAETSEKTE